MENLREKFLNCKEAFESKKMKVNLKKTKMMVSGLKEKILQSEVDPCAVRQQGDGKFSAVHKIW